MSMDRVVASRRTVLSPWVTLAEQDVSRDGRTETYYALDQSDYVNVLALTPEREVALVRQFRPALDECTIELPGGLRESDEEPQLSAIRELREEVGLEVVGKPVLLGNLTPDSGRLQNRLWAYFIPSTRRLPDWQPETSVEPIAVSREELLARIADGRFNCALHVAIIGLAVMKGLF